MPCVQAQLLAQGRLSLRTKIIIDKETKELNPDFNEEEQSCSPFLQRIKADCLRGIQHRQFIFQNTWQLELLHNRVWDTGLLKEGTLHQTAQMKPSASFSIGNI